MFTSGLIQQDNMIDTLLSCPYFTEIKFSSDHKFTTQVTYNLFWLEKLVCAIKMVFECHFMLTYRSIYITTVIHITLTLWI